MTPASSAGVGRLLHHGPVGDGVRERDAELDDVGAGVDQRRDEAVAGLHVRVAAGQVGDERRAPARGAANARVSAAQAARRDASGRSSFAPAGPASSDFAGGLARLFRAVRQLAHAHDSTPSAAPASYDVLVAAAGEVDDHEVAGREAGIGGVELGLAGDREPAGRRRATARSPRPARARAARRPRRGRSRAPG